VETRCFLSGIVKKKLPPLQTLTTITTLKIKENTRTNNTLNTGNTGTTDNVSLDLIKKEIYKFKGFEVIDGQ
jgi:hypothetical protein